MRAKGRGSEPPARKKQNKTKHPIHQRKESAWLNLLPCSLATSMLTVKQGLGFSIAYFSWKSDPKLLKKKSAAHPIKFYSIIVYWARCCLAQGHRSSCFPTQEGGAEMMPGEQSMPGEGWLTRHECLDLSRSIQWVLHTFPADILVFYIATWQ